MKWSFGEFVVDDGARQLLRDGVPVRLQSKALDLLLLLLDARPRVLTKSDLHARLWPSVFVSDTSLAMAVAELRAALGETAFTRRSSSSWPRLCSHTSLERAISYASSRRPPSMADSARLILRISTVWLRTRDHK